MGIIIVRTSVIIALAGAALLTACRKQEIRTVAAFEPAAITASVITVATEPLHTTIPVTGTLVSNARVEVKAEVIGRIARFDKEEGARVAAGEAVAWVDEENYQLSVRQAETAVKVAEAGLARARLVEAHSRTELERAQNLLKSGGITDKDLKAAELADRDARAQAALASAQIEQARAALDLARKRMRDTVIRAPIGGEIVKKLVNKGSYVEAPTPVLTIVDNSRLELESPVASADLAPIKPGQLVTFTVNSYSGERLKGRVVDVAPAVDEQTRSAKVRVQVANPGGKLKAGMFAQGEILTGLNTAAIVMAASAVYRDDRSAKSAYVFVLANGKAERRSVRIGHERDAKLEIAEGLKPGEQVIAEQNIEIAEGVRVQARR
jgi:membrane fusion protein (multidrug efflux system)